jgi:hypothetical protein
MERCTCRVNVDVDVEGGWGNATLPLESCNVNINIYDRVPNSKLREAAKPLGCTTAATMRLPLRLLS